jgi:hypothetical protein
MRLFLLFAASHAVNWRPKFPKEWASLTADQIAAIQDANRAHDKAMQDANRAHDKAMQEALKGGGA